MEIETIYMILALILLFLGIALALFGRAIWDSLMSMIGGMIGWMIGFAVGAWFFGLDTLMGIILAIILGFIGSFIMGAIFGFLVEVALALTAGLLAGGIVFFAMDQNLLYGGIAFAIVAIIAYVLIENVISVVTAFIGSILAAAALWYLMDINYAVLTFFLLFIFGTLIQHFLLDDNTTGR